MTFGKKRLLAYFPEMGFVDGSHDSSRNPKSGACVALHSPTHRPAIFADKLEDMNVHLARCDICFQQYNACGVTVHRKGRPSQQCWRCSATRTRLEGAPSRLFVLEADKDTME